ncbi:hypothetical protein IMSAG192_00850 [Muribaculaceae bacterium]|nr:hypothetical protein IMSAG192_00850 [Muribaculaceae bacterium]
MFLTTTDAIWLRAIRGSTGMVTVTLSGMIRTPSIGFILTNTEVVSVSFERMIGIVSTDVSECGISVTEYKVTESVLIVSGPFTILPRAGRTSALTCTATLRPGLVVYISLSESGATVTICDELPK